MATRIIYHDFQNSVPSTAAALTAPMLSKGRRLYRAAAKLNGILSTACILLCGACIAVSILILIIIGG